MKRITISIETTNANFRMAGGDCEVARILREIAFAIDRGAPPLYVRDIMGNNVGTISFPRLIRRRWRLCTRINHTLLGIVNLEETHAYSHKYATELKTTTSNKQSEVNTYRRL